MVISHKSAQNHTKSPYPAPHKACRFYQAARTPPRIDHYPTPLYTYSCPALLKEWLDRVLSRGFASGPGGNQLAGKYWRSVITTGEPESAYRYDALNRYPMSDVLRPFELAAGMCRMHWLSPIIIYWARRQSAQELASHARAYGDWLANPLSPGGR